VNTEHGLSAPLARTAGVQGNMPGRGTVAAQHQRYFRKKGNFNHPRKIFGKQLLTQLKAWRAAGDKIILFADLNENIYTGPLARQLRGDGILMHGYSVGPKYEFILIDKGIVERVAVTFSGYRQ
jgi:hypothetical protein